MERYFGRPVKRHKRVLDTIKEVNTVYYTAKVSPSEKVYAIEQDDDSKWVVVGPFTVEQLAITHDRKLGLAITYHLSNGKWYQETLNKQDIIHVQLMQARAACYWRQKGAKLSIQGSVQGSVQGQGVK